MNKAIDLKPTSADAYRYRCSARIAKRDFTGAISDCSKTLSLNPRYVDAYFARGNAYNALSEWGAGIADLTQTIKLDPRASDAYNHRAWPYLILNRNDLAYSDAASYLRLEGATGESVSYVVLIAYFAKKQAGEANAAAILDEWGPRIKSAAWPYAVIRYLRHEMNEQELLGSAKDKEQTIESRAYLGMSLLLPGQREAALPHLNWVRENGSQEVYECGWTVECVAPFGGRCEVTGDSSTLGMSQVLRVTVNGRDGNDTFRVRFAWMKIHAGRLQHRRRVPAHAAITRHHRAGERWSERGRFIRCSGNRRRRASKRFCGGRRREWGCANYQHCDRRSNVTCCDLVRRG